MDITRSPSSRHEAPTRPSCLSARPTAIKGVGGRVAQHGQAISALFEAGGVSKKSRQSSKDLGMNQRIADEAAVTDVMKERCAAPA